MNMRSHHPLLNPQRKRKHAIPPPIAPQGHARGGLRRDWLAGRLAAMQRAWAAGSSPDSSAAPAPQLSADDLARAWPCFRGRGGSGISPYANVPDDWDGPAGKNILWKTAVPLRGNDSPVIVAGHVFLTGADEEHRQVYCFDAAGGKRLWQAELPSSPDSNKLDLRDSQREAPGFAACTMATDGRYAAAIFANGDLAAYDLNGKLAWSKSFGIPVNPYGHAASLTIYNDLLLVPFDQGEVKAKKSKLRAGHSQRPAGLGGGPSGGGASGRRPLWSMRPAAIN